MARLVPRWKCALCQLTSVFIGGLLFLIHQYTDGYVSLTAGLAYRVRRSENTDRDAIWLSPGYRADECPSRSDTLEGEDVLPGFSVPVAEIFS